MSIRLMTAVWEHPEIDGSMLLTALVLADHADDDGICWPAVPTIARKARSSERTVRRQIKQLCDAGLLVVEPREGHTNRYRLTVEPQGAGRGGQNGRGGTVAGGGGHAEPQGGIRDGLRSVIEPPINRHPPRSASEESAAVEACRYAGKVLGTGGTPQLQGVVDDAIDAGFSVSEIVEAARRARNKGVHTPAYMRGILQAREPGWLAEERKQQEKQRRQRKPAGGAGRRAGGSARYPGGAPPREV